MVSRDSWIFSLIDRSTLRRMARSFGLSWCKIHQTSDVFFRIYPDFLAGILGGFERSGVPAHNGHGRACESASIPQDHRASAARAVLSFNHESAPGSRHQPVPGADKSLTT